MILIDGKEWRPIAFVDQLVASILIDEKTETRRIVSGAPHDDKSFHALNLPHRFLIFNESEIRDYKSPYGKPGDRLWVRESFLSIDNLGRPCRIEDATSVVFRNGGGRWKSGSVYDFDAFQTSQAVQWKASWRPPMHLPFWAHRIGLEVKSIRLERLQAITEAGAVAEGFKLRGNEFDYPVSALSQFRNKWDVINGKRIDENSGKPLTWDLNAFVWVVGFERIKT